MKTTRITLCLIASIMLIGISFNLEANDRRPQQANVIELTQEQFENATPERQAHINENPDMYRIVEQPALQRQTRETQRLERRTSDDGRMIITNEQYERLSPERKQHIKDNSERFIIEDKSTDPR